jgi:hypothetical protein
MSQRKITKTGGVTAGRSMKGGKIEGGAGQRKIAAGRSNAKHPAIYGKAVEGIGGKATIRAR